MVAARIARRSSRAVVGLSMMLAVAGGVMFAGQASGRQASAPTTFEVDAVHSAAVFRILHGNVAPFWGRIDGPRGSVVLDGDNVSFDVTLELAKIETGNKGRDDHLKGADFFNAEQFPLMTFKSTSSTKTGENTWDVTGDLTIRGVTKEITVPITRTGEADLGGQFGYRAGFEGEFTINRVDYGVAYRPEALSTDVKVIIGINAKRN